MVEMHGERVLEQVAPPRGQFAKSPSGTSLPSISGQDVGNQAGIHACHETADDDLQKDQRHKEQPRRHGGLSRNRRAGEASREQSR